MEQLFRCWVLWLMSGFFATVAAETLTFGVVPQQSAVKLLREWAPLLDAVSQKSGIELHFATAPNIPTFEQRVRDGVYDIAYMNPYHLTVFADDPGYVPLVKAEHKVIKGIMVVRKDATLAQLDELDSQTLAFPAPGSFAATLLTQASLTLKASVLRANMSVRTMLFIRPWLPGFTLLVVELSALSICWSHPSKINYGYCGPHQAIPRMPLRLTRA